MSENEHDLQAPGTIETLKYLSVYEHFAEAVGESLSMFTDPQQVCEQLRRKAEQLADLPEDQQELHAPIAIAEVFALAGFGMLPANAAGIESQAKGSEQSRAPLTKQEIPEELQKSELGVYGYLPTPDSYYHTSRYGIDWTDKSQVLQLKQQRIQYLQQRQQNHVPPQEDSQVNHVPCLYPGVEQQEALAHRRAVAIDLLTGLAEVKT
ncbi:hypothetical protein [Oceanobacter mangrovi]|uniref:hypothetical protein n=1 Tax=Oceanobacter mangrovi TaxID=2862510 RepID=UPI001C8DC738|nr:hypothetical protein [Oceanobacter mangrovi]